MRKALAHVAVSVLIIGIVVTISADGMRPERFADLWRTRDQQGQRLMVEGKYAEAAERFLDPMRKATAYVKAGDFERAASVYSQVGTAESYYNRGNCLTLLGEYQRAIESYDKALKVDPNLTAAETNRGIAYTRWKYLQKKSEEDTGTGGKQEADEFVFDEHGKKGRSGDSDSHQEAVAETNALWLRRVQTRPADFLRLRFLYQAKQKESTK